MPGALIDGIAEHGGAHFIDTNLVTGYSPLKLASLPFNPTDYAIGVPLLAASLIVAPSSHGQKLRVAVAAIFGMVLAMTVAAFVTAQGEASATGLTELASSSSRQPYEPPGPLMRGALAALQNCLVYFNLLILPFVIFFLRPSRPAAPLGEERRMQRRG